MVQVKGLRIDIRLLAVFTACMAVAATGGVLLYRDIISGGAKGTGEPMAKIDRKESKVRRKASASYSWGSVDRDEKLYRKDSVQTGSNSAAAIRMNDGTLLEIGENSLVVIDDLKNIALNFTKGSLVLRTQSGDSKISVGLDGKTRIEELPIRLLKPESLAVLFATPAEKNKEIQFAWELRPNAQNQIKDPASIFIEIAKDKTFKGTGVVKVKIEDINSKTLLSKLAAGKYFWRMSRIGVPMTEISQFRVAQAMALKATSPAGGARVQIWEEDPSVQFGWMVPQGQEFQDELTRENVEHKIEISSDPRFKTIALSQAINPLSGTATLHKLPIGGLYWRIKSRYEDSNAGQVNIDGAAESFTVEKAQKLAIELLKPDDKGSLELQPQVRFSWNAEASLVEYEWQIEKTDGTKIDNQRIKSLSYLWKKPLTGVFKWRVLALMQKSSEQKSSEQKRAEKQTVGESPWRTFSIYTGTPVALQTPLKDEEKYYWNQEKPEHFDFEWNKDALVSGNESVFYQVDTAKDVEFSQLMASSKKLKTNSVSSREIKLLQGEFYWRVTLVDQNGQPIKTSEIRKSAYGLHPPLKAPTAIRPPAGLAKNIVEDPTDMEVAWTDVKFAENYELVIYDPSPNRTLASVKDGKSVFQITTDKTALSIPYDQIKRLPAASYQWTVRAIDKFKRKGEAMVPRPLTFTYGEPLGAPEIITPEVIN